jgi:hypothetical protein
LSRVVHRQTLPLSDTGAFVWPACVAAFSMVKISRSRGSRLGCSLRPSPSSNNRCKPRCRKFYGRPTQPVRASCQPERRVSERCSASKIRTRTRRRPGARSR